MRAVSHTGRPVRVLVADEHALFRAAIRSALEATGELLVVAESGDGIAATDELQRNGIDVALLDANLPERDGVQTCAAIRAAGLATKVIIISETADQRVLVESVRAGADGYTTKESRLADLVAAVAAVANGQACIPPEMLGTLLRDLIERRREEDAALERFSSLSKREREVVGLLVEGHDHDAIAKCLVISPETSRTHIQNAMGKLGVHSRLEATALVTEHNLLDRFPVGRGA